MGMNLDRGGGDAGNDGLAPLAEVDFAAAVAA
jgi:hypothetical protein